jgi:hypothetical protein
VVKLRDDERYLLAISRPSGCLVECSAISSSRMTGIRRKWTLMGWLNPGSDQLTNKAMYCKVTLPEVVPIESVEVEVEIDVPSCPLPEIEPESETRAWDPDFVPIEAQKPLLDEPEDFNTYDD